MARGNERAKLIRRIEKAGYEVSISGKGHYKVKPSQKRLAELQANGVDTTRFPAFVVMAATPSDPHSEKRALKDMKSIGYTA